MNVYRSKQVGALATAVSEQNNVLGWIIAELDNPKTQAVRAGELETVLLEVVSLMQTLSGMLQQVATKIPQNPPTLQ